VADTIGRYTAFCGRLLNVRASVKKRGALARSRMKRFCSTTWTSSKWKPLWSEFAYAAANSARHAALAARDLGVRG